MTDMGGYFWDIFLTAEMNTFSWVWRYPEGRGFQESALSFLLVS